MRSLASPVAVVCTSPRQVSAVEPFAVALLVVLSSFSHLATHTPTCPSHIDTMSPPDTEVKGVSTGKNVLMASRGRAPWYTPDGKVVPAYVIGIAGGSSSGKVS